MFQRGSVQERIDALIRRSENMKEEDIWLIFAGLCAAVKEMHSHEPAYAHR